MQEKANIWQILITAVGGGAFTGWIAAVFSFGKKVGGFEKNMSDIDQRLDSFELEINRIRTLYIEADKEILDLFGTPGGDPKFRTAQACEGIQTTCQKHNDERHRVILKEFVRQDDKMDLIFEKLDKMSEAISKMKK